MKLFRISPHLFILLLVFFALLFTGCEHSYTDEQVESIKESVYDSAYNDGYEQGGEDRFSEAYDSGYDDGYNDGIDDSSQDTYDAGYDDGYDEGYDDGYDAGLNGEKKHNNIFDNKKKLNEDYFGEGVNQTVYITKTGTKYHIQGCQYLRYSSIAITLGDAIDKGYTPCFKCNPPE